MKEKTKPFTDVTMPREVRYDLAEHEVILSFNGDDDAAFFDEWWNTEGNVAFAKWLAERPTEEQ